METHVRKPLQPKSAKARQAVSHRLRRFYGALVTGLEADADEFFRRVMEQKTHRDHEGAQPQH